MRAVFVAMAISLGASAALAQGGTDIWVAELRGQGSALEFGRPRNLTNRAGYDNQPQFTASSALPSQGPSAACQVTSVHQPP